jgi:hypothetical protein
LKKIKKYPEKHLTKGGKYGIIKVQKKKERYKVMMDWEVMENYEALVEVIHEYLESQAE